MKVKVIHIDFVHIDDGLIAIEALDEAGGRYHATRLYAEGEEKGAVNAVMADNALINVGTEWRRGEFAMSSLPVIEIPDFDAILADKEVEFDKHLTVHVLTDVPPDGTVH